MIVRINRIIEKYTIAYNKAVLENDEILAASYKLQIQSWKQLKKAIYERRHKERARSERERRQLKRLEREEFYSTLRTTTKKN